VKGRSGEYLTLNQILGVVFLGRGAGSKIRHSIGRLPLTEKKKEKKNHIHKKKINKQF